MTPNLSIDPAGGRLVTVKGEVKERYTSFKHISVVRSIPRDILLLANYKDAPGIKRNGEIFFDELQPWLAQNYDSLKKELDDAKAVKEKESSIEGRRDKLELAKLQEEVIKLRNANRAKDADFISRKLVFATFKRVVAEFSTETRRIYENEQPIKTQNLPAEKIVEINKEFNNQLFAKLGRPLTDWATGDDLENGEGDKQDVST